MILNDFVNALLKETTNLFGVKYDEAETLIGVRGITIQNNEVILNDDSFNHFNDVLFNIASGVEAVDYRTVTMDPGNVSRQFLKNFGVTNGEARVEPGLYRMKLGDHRGHVALVLASDITVRRDAAGRHLWDEKDPVYRGQFGIHIHAQGVDKNFVGQSSLGCTVTKSTWTEPDWLTFISMMLLADKDARASDPNFSGFIYAVHNQELAKRILAENE